MVKYGKYGKVRRLQGFLTRRVCEKVRYWGSDIGFENEMDGRRAGVSLLWKSQKRKPYAKLAKLHGYDKLDNPYENNRLWHKRSHHYGRLARRRGKKALTVDEVSFQYPNHDEFKWKWELTEFFK